MSIQINDGHELMLDCVHQRDGTKSLRATHVGCDGESDAFNPAMIALEATRYRTSRVTKIGYPTVWCIRTEDGRIDLGLELERDANEFGTRGSTATFYAENPATVTGTHRGVAVTGRASLESVGPRPRLVGCFDHRHQNMPLLGYFLNETRCRLRTWTDQVTRLRS